MIGRFVARIVILLATVSIGIVVLAAFGFFGFLFYKVAAAERLSITGMVTDCAGRPLKGVEVRAAPLPIHDPFSDHSMLVNITVVRRS
jgi:hypothetical protein